MALYYWVGGTNTWNATATGKWSNSDGGSPFYTNPPGSNDDVFFTALSGAVTVTLGAIATVRTLTFTGFTGTFTFSQNLVIISGMTLGVSTTYTTSGTPTSFFVRFQPATATTATIIANGKTIPTSIELNNANGATVELNGNANFSGDFSSTTIAHNLKSVAGSPCDLRIGGNIALRATTINTTDHVTLKGYGAATKTILFGGTNTRISIASGGVYTSAASCTGTGICFLVVETGGVFSPNPTHTFGGALGSTTTISGFNSLNTSDFFGIIAGNIILSNDTVVKSKIEIQTGAITITSGASKLLLEGNLTSTSSATTIIDRLEFSGTTASTVSAVTTTGNLQIKNLSFNKTGAGSVNFTSTLFALFIPAATTYTWTHTSGTVTYSPSSVIRFSYNTSNSTMVYSESISLSTPSTINSLILPPGILQINSPLRATTLTILGTSIVFTGSAGWTCDNLICSTQGTTITLQSLITYTTTTSVNMLGANASRILMRSSDLTIPYDLAIWTFNGNTQSMIYVNATAIDSDFGQTIWSFQGTTNGIDASTRNWNPGTKPETQGITFVN
jgi:hypothetical protein